MCTNWPMPIAPVSPAPLMPMANIFPFASRAPVPTDGMRPWTELKPCASPRKYAGLLLEHPIPESLMTSRGWMPISKNASMMRSVIALWPQPAHSVVLPPRYGCISRPMRFFFLPVSGDVGVGSMVLFRGVCLDGARGGRDGRGRRLLPFLHEDVVGQRACVDGQAVVVQHAPDVVRRRRRQVVSQQHAQLRVPVLLDEVHARVAREKRIDLRGERIPPDAHVGSLDAFRLTLRPALHDRPRAGAS